MQIKNISPKVDSCAGLIAQQVYKAHQQLKSEHKRWIDPEDMLQEALMEAVEAEKRYKEESPAKYSTYLTRGLFYRLRRAYLDRVRQKKRDSSGVVELDAPVYDEGPLREVPDKSPLVEVRWTQNKRAIHALLAYCRAVSPPVRMAAVQSLLFGLPIQYERIVGKVRRMDHLGRPKTVTLGELIVAESRPVIASLGIQWSDFEIFKESEKSRKMALIQLLSSGIIGLTDTDARLLECIGCSGQFALSDVRDGRFVISTMTCRVCYKALAEDPVRCFGKTKTAEHQGYSESDIECRVHCMDRKVCKQYIKGDSVMAKKVAAVDAVEALADVEFEDDKKPVKASKGKKEDKPAAKVVAKKKAAKEEEEEAAPAEVGKWPYKKNSWMRWIFESLVNGISKKEFEDTLKKNGMDSEKWLNMFRRGKNGHKNGITTHSWKINEEGGRLKFFDLKYYPNAKAKAAKAEKEEKPEAKATAKAAPESKSTKKKAKAA